MRRSLGMAVLPVAALGGCANDVSSGAPEYLASEVKQVSDSVFAVGILAKNADEYAFVRCVAANHAKYQEADSFGELEGEALHTRFRSVDGKRVTESYGFRQFTIETTGENAPAKIYSVPDMLAECELNGIPTSATAGSTGGTG
jgi:hypothetical protein